MRHEGWDALGRRMETPALCLDLDLLDTNLADMARAVAQAGKLWRPHAKSHKCPEIALRQLAAGAIGITCAKVSEAEVFAQAGVRDILIAHLPVGPSRIDRVVKLCQTADPIVTLDHYAQAEPLAAACVRGAVTCRVLVDINIGMNRTGITPGRDAIELAQAIDRLSGLKLAGIMGYEGHAMSIMDAEAKQRLVRDSLSLLDQARQQFLQAGLPCDIVSAGGTGTLAYAAECPGITELQSGGGIFGDPHYTRMPGVPAYKPALTILATVVSRPALDRAILDAGRKTVAPDLHPPVPKNLDARIVAHHAEHIGLQLGPESQNLRIGDLVELIVGYADYTVPMHDEFLCFQGNRLHTIWPIAARGKLQ